MKRLKSTLMIIVVLAVPGFSLAQVAGKVFSVMASNQTDSPLRVRSLSITDDSMARSVKVKNFGDKRIVGFKLGYAIFVYDGQARVAQGNLISKESHPIDQSFDVDVEPGESVTLANVSLLGRAEALDLVSNRNRWHHYVFVFGVTEIRFEDGTSRSFDLLNEGNFKSKPQAKSPLAAISPTCAAGRLTHSFLPVSFFAQDPEPEEGGECPNKLCDHSGGSCVGSNSASKCSWSLGYCREWAC